MSDQVGRSIIRCLTETTLHKARAGTAAGRKLVRLRFAAAQLAESAP